MSIKDIHCGIAGDVLGNYTCVLNQTDIVTNKNKFYIMQLIKTSSSCFNLFIRYGRIGEKGKTSTTPYPNEQSAINKFNTQFYSKTGNLFGKPFIKHNGKYFLTDIEKPELDDESDNSNSDSSSSKENLDDDLKFLINLISNEKMLNNTLIQLNIDPKKLPLGKISSSQLKKAEDILNTIKKMILKDDDPSETKLNQLSSEFYTYVPLDFKRSEKPLLIDEEEIVDKYLDMVNELKNITVTYKLIKNNKNKSNNLENIYDNLDTDITPLDKEKPIYKQLVKYIKNSQGGTHPCKLDILNIYRVEKDTDDNYKKMTSDMENKTLLFHGSSLSNWCSILKNGLYLDPSKLGVPITGKMFGYGIYWANSVSKSFNYCSSYATNNIAVLAIGEVALGEIHELYAGNGSISQKYLDKINKNSVKGMGVHSPSDGVIIGETHIPNGKIKKVADILVNSPAGKPDPHKKYSLLYDEYVIYNTNQYRIKYLVVVKNVM